MAADDDGCQTEIDEYLASNHRTKITKGNMAGSGFARRFDGRYHSSVKAPRITRCQYCNYVWRHTMNAKEQETESYGTESATHFALFGLQREFMPQLHQRMAWC